MIHQLTQKFVQKFDDEVRFFKGWLDGPKSVGTPFPTSIYTGRAMANFISTSSGLPVLEVGPGTGTITRAILARGVKQENLYAVEYSANFVAGLVREFPGAHILHGDAFKMDSVLDTITFDCVISGVPLLNFPMVQRIAYLEDMLSRIPAGRPVVQITYGPMSPVPAGLGKFSVERADFIVRNVPPAQLWTYRKSAG